MNEKKTKGFVLTAGGSSLLTIFAVLCLITFAMLALSKAAMDEKISKKMADSVSAYYKADCAAEEILGEIRSGNLPEGVEQKDDLYTYQCPVTESMALKVKVRRTQTGYRIISWNRVYTGDWEIDDSIDVWDGGF